MESLFDILSLINNYIIHGIFISVLLIGLLRHFSKRISVRNAVNVVRWTIISYACLCLTYLLVNWIISPPRDSSAFVNRASGPYAFAYWAMTAAHTLLPFVLLSKKHGQKLKVIFLVALLMNLGWLLEIFIIRLTSVHRDYLPSSFKMETNVIVSGLLFAVFAMAVGNSFPESTTGRGEWE